MLLIVLGVFLFLLSGMGRRGRLVGQDANGVLRKSLPQVTQYSILMSVIYAYLLMDQGGVYKGTVG